MTTHLRHEEVLLKDIQEKVNELTRLKHEEALGINEMFAFLENDPHLGPIITFTNKDIMYKNPCHNRPLYISVFANKVKMGRALLDIGSSVNRIPLNLLEPLLISFPMIDQSNAAYIHGVGKLVNITFGTVSFTIAVDSVCDKHTFYVLDTEPLYHLLLGRPWIHFDKGIASSYHQCFKFVWKGSQRRITGEKRPF